MEGSYFHMSKSRKMITKSEINGIVVPMVTPFKGEDASRVDLAALAKLTQYLVEGGVHGLMPLGTSGEFALMDREERRDVVSTVVKAANHRVPVIAGVSSPGTRDATNLARDATKAGADVIIATGPYYFKTSAEGLIDHFQTLLENSGGLPLMIYNIPSWVGYNIPPKVVKKLAVRNPRRVVGVKFTTNDLSEFLDYLRLLRNDMSIMIGADALILPALVLGAAGAVVGSANVLPELTSQIFERYKEGNLDKAKELQRKLDPFSQTMDLGTFPAGLKAALKLIGLSCGPVRPPLVDLNSAGVRLVRASLSWKLTATKN
jgi:4-hydroxy-tetrahydrodipicolinate synthase